MCISRQCKYCCCVSSTNWINNNNHHHHNHRNRKSNHHKFNKHNNGFNKFVNHKSSQSSSSSSLSLWLTSLTKHIQFSVGEILIKIKSSLKLTGSTIDDNNQRKQHYCNSLTKIYLIIILITFSVYANSIPGDFVHDDIEAIVRNPDVIGTNNWSAIWLNDFWGRPMSDPLSHKSYRPLTILTFR